MIYLTSDFHFNHDKEFIYKSRGFNTIEEMNIAIISNFNNIISSEDDVYILGDLCLGKDLEKNKKLISSLNGNLHIIRGNHDTDNKIEMYKECPNVVEIENALYFKYNNYHFFFSHFPCLSGNLSKESLKQLVLNLYGHTHQTTKLFNDSVPYMYHVGVDAHNCKPILLDDIIEEMKIQYEKVKNHYVTLKEFKLEDYDL